jgi:hypothetical protein
MYKIRVRNKSGEILGDFNTWQGLQFKERLNNYGGCSFNVPVSDPDTFDLIGLRTLETLILKNDVIVWAGEQVARDVELSANSNNRIELISYSFFELLNHMYSSTFIRYEGIDQGQILKDLVDTWQALPNGDLGITFNTIPATELRDRSYYNYNVMQAWENMSKVLGGPDFYFHPNKSVDILPRIGVDRSKSVFFQWGVNIEKVQIRQDFVNPTNRAIMLGEGFGEEQLVVTGTNSTLASVYGLRGQTFSEIDINNSDLLIDKAVSNIQRFGTALTTITFDQIQGTSPGFGSVRVGDIVRIKVNEGIYNINNNFRIYEYNVKVDNEGRETVSYYGALI